MQIENTFTVPVPVAEAWAVLLDVEKVAPCMPGATLESVDGDTFSGRVKTKVGPVTLTYKGRAEFVARDETARKATLKARGRDSRGQGTAAATVTMQLIDQGDTTRVELVTDLDITGRPAQLGRGVMTDVGNKIIGIFADALAEQLSSGKLQAAADPPPVTDASSVSQATRTRTPPSRPKHAAPDSINIIGLAGGSLRKRIWKAITRPLRRLFGRP